MAATVTVQQFLSQATDRLRTSGVDSPRLSAELLLCSVRDMDRIGLLTCRDDVLSQEVVDQAEVLVRRRCAGEPVAYLLGRREFFGLDFKVGPGVLVPRPETEHIIEEVEQYFSRDESWTACDFGTGSGILPVTLAVRFPQLHILAFDLSEQALEYARENARMHGVQSRVEFVHADFTRPLLQDGSLDFVVSNPPYISKEEFDELSPEVAEYEPSLALTPGESGMESIIGLLPRASAALKPGGMLFLEMGWQQGRAVEDAAYACGGWKSVTVLPDLAGLDRVVVLVKA